MSQPFIFIGTHALREGQLHEYERYFREFASDVVEAKEPRLLAFNGYASEDGRETTVVQVHPDADSMLFHMSLVTDHVSDAYERFLAGTAGIEIYGEPNEATLEMVKQLAGSGVPVRVKPLGIGGFTRTTAGRQLAASP